jgi:hypothetical protein
MKTAADFIESLRMGTADEGATIALWHLVYILNRGIKIDMAAPQDGWALRVKYSPDARYVNLFAQGKPAK